MKKKDETRYFVTDVASVPVYKVARKTEMFRMSTKPGRGVVEWYSAADNYTNPVTRDRSDKTQIPIFGYSDAIFELLTHVCARV